MTKSKKAKKQEANESLDNLLRRSEALRSSSEFKNFLDFVAKFKQYKPFNNMLVYTQNPKCEYFATEKHWKKAFDRTIKPNANPMVILAPMHPVLFVYDMQDTIGEEIPEKVLKETYIVSGKYRDKWYDNLQTHFSEFNIIVKELKMQSSSAGSISRKDGKLKIELNANHENPVKLATILHELGHLFLGHLGSMDTEKFPKRTDLSKNIVEIEAEAVSYIVLERFGLKSNSHEYLALYNASPEDLQKISTDLIIKIAGKLEKMVLKSHKK